MFALISLFTLFRVVNATNGFLHSKPILHMGTLTLCSEQQTPAVTKGTESAIPQPYKNMGKKDNHRWKKGKTCYGSERSWIDSLKESP